MAIGLARTQVNPEEEAAPDVAMPVEKAPPMPWMHDVIPGPRRANLRETIDDPVTAAGINSMYKDAANSFSPLQGMGSRRYPEILSPIDVQGRLGQGSTGEGQRDPNGEMHAKSSIPYGSLAIIHTHPQGQDPRTSPGDENAANQLQRPNYAMSSNAIWAAEPNNPNPVPVANIEMKKGQLQYKWRPMVNPKPAPPTVIP